MDTIVAYLQEAYALLLIEISRYPTVHPEGLGHGDLVRIAEHLSAALYAAGEQPLAQSTPQRQPPCRTETGTVYAINRSLKLAYRRVKDGPWEQTELLSKNALAEEEMVGSAHIDDGWFSLYCLPLVATV